MDGFLVFLIMGVIYFIPTIIVISNRHKNSGGIFILNLLLGWTLLGWIGALIWSVTNTK